MRPPRHKITEPLRIIDTSDKAWDEDKIVAELEDLEGDEVAQHPMVMYRLGETHFDLDAPGEVLQEDGSIRTATPRDYLRDAPPPVTFEARRLTPMEVATCLDRGDHVGRLWAFHLAVKRIENAAELEYHVQPRKQATDNQVQAVADALGVDVVLRIGRSVLDASRAPTPAEGKPSGSSPGAPSPGRGVSPEPSSPGTASATA